MVTATTATNLSYADGEIMKHLRWLYKERRLCQWCQHPKHLPKTKGLCNSCYQLARDYRKKPTDELGIAVSLARREGSIDPVTYPVDGLTIESLFEEVASAVFPWRKITDNPFFHSANTWGENFSKAQLRLLFHEFSMITRERQRRGRRAMAFNIVMYPEKYDKHKEEIEQRLLESKKTVEALFLRT